MTERNDFRWVRNEVFRPSRTTIPREFEAQGYAPGSSVLVEELPGGELRIISTEKVSERIREIGARVVGEHDEALRILADHDPDSTQG
jgi:hypothetical protein